MSDGYSSSVQALGALGVSLNSSANNIANMSTEGFRSSSVNFADGAGGRGVEVSSVTRSQTPGVDITRDMVNMMQVENSYAANATMIRTGDEITGTVLNMIA